MQSILLAKSANAKLTWNEKMNGAQALDEGKKQYLTNHVFLKLLYTYFCGFIIVRTANRYDRNFGFHSDRYRYASVVLIYPGLSIFICFAMSQACTGRETSATS
jgi:hypothetical protein